MLALVFAFAMIFLAISLIQDITTAVVMFADALDTIRCFVLDAYDHRFNYYCGPIPFDQGNARFEVENAYLEDNAIISGSSDKSIGNDKVKIKKKDKKLRSAGFENDILLFSARNEFVNISNNVKTDNLKHLERDCIENNMSSICEESKTTHINATDTSEDRLSTRWGLIDATVPVIATPKPVYPARFVKGKAVKCQRMMEQPKITRIPRKQSLQSLAEYSSCSDYSSCDSVPVSSPPPSPLREIALKQVLIAEMTKKNVDEATSINQTPPSETAERESLPKEASDNEQVRNLSYHDELDKDLPELPNCLPSFSFGSMNNVEDEEEAFGNFVEIETLPNDVQNIPSAICLAANTHNDDGEEPRLGHFDEDDEESQFGQFADIEEMNYDCSWVSDDSPIALGIQVDYSAWPNRKRLECKSKRTPEEIKDSNPRPTKRCKGVVGC